MDITYNTKLPVIDIFSEAIQLPLKNIKPILRFGTPLIIIDVLIIFGTELYPYQDSELTTPEYAIAFIIGIFYLATMVMAIIGCHRTFLLPKEIINNTNMFRWSGREMRYLLWWIVIGIAATLIILPIIFTFMHNINENEINDSYLLLSIIYIPPMYFISRLSLILPATAIDKRNRSFSWSWKLSSTNGWRLTLLIGFIPFITNLFFAALPEIDSIMYSLFTDLVWAVIAVIEICLLSLCYSFLSKLNTTHVTQNC